MTGYAVQNILSRAYFARQKGKVPLAAGAASILVNVLLCMALAQRMGVAGLALSSAVSSTVYALLLDIPLELYTPMFAMARIVGWSAHRIEELINMDKIIRPAYKSIMKEREYVPMEER